VATTAALGACGGSGDGAGTVAAGGASTTTSAATSTSTSTTAEPAAASTSTAVPGAEPVSTERVCDIAATLLLRPPGIVRESPTSTPAEQDDMLGDLAAALPADQQEGWAEFVAQVRAHAPGAEADPAAQARFAPVLERAARWARTQCPEAPPSWICESEETGSGMPSYLPGDEDASPTPEAALESLAPPAGGEELGRDDDAVLYGWVDADGFLIRTIQVRQTDDGAGWRPILTLECAAGG